MAAVPSLMFLFCNDATEVRYSDGSKLEISACGSSLIYQDHKKTIGLKGGKFQKRTRFVTSEHRSKVLQALDFRNRFADRPYLCPELLHKDDIIALYANIDKVVWPKGIEESSVQVLEDGSRRITSVDEYASLVVSPHCQDFTVCYLSRVSPESRKSSGYNQSFKSSTSTNKSSTTEDSTLSESSEKRSTNVLRPKEAVIHPFSSNQTLNHHSAGLQQTSTGDLDIHERKINKEFTQTFKTEKTSLQAGILLKNDGNSDGNTKEVVLPRTNCDFTDYRNINIPQHKPSGNISFTPIDGSPSSHEISSISRSSTPDGLRTTIETDVSHDMSHDERLVYRHRHSSPTRRSSSPCHQNPEFFPPVFKHGASSSGDQDLENDRTIGDSPHECSRQLGSDSLEVTLRGEQVCDTSLCESRVVIGSSMENLPLIGQGQNQTSQGQTGHGDTNDAQKQNNVSSTFLPNATLHSGKSTHTSTKDNISSAKSTPCKEQISVSQSEVTDKTIDSSNTDSRSSYVWRTQHVSRNNCPAVWTHPLRLALEGKSVADDGEETDSHLTAQHFQSSAGLIKYDKTKCSVATLPQPLPLTCPFQHEHRRDQTEAAIQGHNNSSTEEFFHGKLKIIISEGIVFRLIHHAEMKVIEIHPGDGSILVSQGVSGHFFVHYLLLGDRLEERTYSVKSLPHELSKGSYSIGKLIKTAHRFFLMAKQWDMRGVKEETPCWKKEMIAIVEPLSSSLLEECEVDGVGRFSAFNNGRVRVVFEDRGMLDLQCDFSPRLEKAAVSPMYKASPASQSTGRLMLPSGNFLTVDLSNPGPHHRYVSRALEWVAWVNTSPQQRREFYQKQHLPSVMKRAAELEMKKIFCFNYILDHKLEEIDEGFSTSSEKGRQGHPSVFTSNNFPISSSTSETVPETSTSNSILTSCTNTMTDLITPPSHVSSSHRSVSHISSSHIATGNALHSSHINNIQKVDKLNISPSPFVQPQGISDGFYSVHQALLQTSSLISDIDSFLESTKEL